MKLWLGYLGAFCFGVSAAFGVVHMILVFGPRPEPERPVACDCSLAEDTLRLAAGRLQTADRDLRVALELLKATNK